MGALRELKRRLATYDEVVSISEIARRYFAMNAFDGVVTIIGVLAGSMVAGVESARVVVVTGLTTSVAIGISGLWGAYLTETAERARDIDELERHTLTSLEGTQIAKASRAAVWIVTAVDGLSPFLAGVIVLLPFFFSGLFADIAHVYYAALGLSLLVLFGLGVFLGRVSKRNVLLYGLQTVLAGLISIGISLLLGAE